MKLGRHSNKSTEFIFKILFSTFATGTKVQGVFVPSGTKFTQGVVRRVKIPAIALSRKFWQSFPFGVGWLGRSSLDENPSIAHSYQIRSQASHFAG